MADQYGQSMEPAVIRQSTWRRLRAEFLALCIAAAAIVGGLFTLPGMWLLELGPLDFIQRPGGSPYVVWRTKARLPMLASVRYQARIVKVALPDGPAAFDSTVCEGTGRLPQSHGRTTELRISITDWLQDPDCILRRGFSYYGDVTVTFRFLGFTKTVTQRSETVTIPIVRTLLGPTFPPRL